MYVLRIIHNALPLPLYNLRTWRRVNEMHEQNPEISMF
jgi:hypothetical protein